jgi:hypothetical protein
MNKTSLQSQQGAATLLVTVILTLIITIGGISISQQISKDTQNSNQLYFRNKALEASNAGISAFIAQLTDDSLSKTFLDSINTTTPIEISLNSKFSLTNAGYTLSAIKVGNDADGNSQLLLTSTGCYPSDCSSGKSVVNQYISYNNLGGISNDWLSVNKNFNRLWGTSVNVHNAPQGTTGTGIGGAINNCSGGDVTNPTSCVGASITQATPPEGGAPIDVYNMSGSSPDEVYYSNWECTDPTKTETCKESAIGASGKKPAKRPQLSDQKYFEKYYGKNSKESLKDGFKKGKYSSADFPASSYVWVDGNVTMQADGKLRDSKGNIIDTEGKHVFIDGNLTSSPVGTHITVDAASDNKWEFLYVSGDMKIQGTLRINGPTAIQGDFNIHGSLQFYADTADNKSFPPFKTITYNGKSGWRDF